jgi:hypothetical protein
VDEGEDDSYTLLCLALDHLFLYNGQIDTSFREKDKTVGARARTSSIKICLLN